MTVWLDSCLLRQILNLDQEYIGLVGEMIVDLEYIKIVNLPFLINGIASWSIMRDGRLDIQLRKQFGEISLVVWLIECIAS